MDYEQALKAYRAQHGNCRRRKIKFQLTFDEWCTWWHNTGQYDRRGLGAGQVVMARIDPARPYRTDNIYLATNAEAAEHFWTTPKSRTASKNQRTASLQRRRTVVTPLGQFQGLKTAARRHRLSQTGLRWRMEHYPKDYYYKN